MALTFSQLLLIVIVVVPLALAVSGRVRVDLAALGIACGLAVAQLLGFEMLGPAGSTDAVALAISGFGRPVVVTLISLFIISRVLDRVGITSWLARRILWLSGTSELRMIALFTAASMAFSLFMNNVAVGALLLPSAIVAAKRSGIRPGKLLIPIAYGTLLGGSATYFTTANIIVDTLLRSTEPPQPGLNVLAFTPTGGLIALVGFGFLILFGRRMLPARAPMSEQILSLPTGSELEDIYQLGERLWEARVLPWSEYANHTISECSIGQRYGLSVLAIWHGRQAIFYPTADQVVRPNDILVMVGREDRIKQLTDRGLEIGRGNTSNHISERGVSFVEIILAPHSRADGQTLKQLNFRKRFNFTAVALLRDGRSYRTDVADFELKRGDTFLMVGSRADLRKLQSNDMFIVLETDISDQPLQRRPAVLSVAITFTAVIASVIGVPVYIAMLMAATAMVATRLILMEDAYRSVEWQVIFLVAAMYSVSVAMEQTGLAATIGTGFLALVEPFGPLGLAAGCFLLSSALTHLMGGQVTALVTGPIAISAAMIMQTNPQAIAVATALGCSAAYLSPIAHPVNMLMMGPGNYQFSDFFRIGLPILILSFIAMMLGMVLFWQL
jgi:di/tricarboxylate transporter